jgi:hypothetical protein
MRLTVVASKRAMPSGKVALELLLKADNTSAGDIR